MSDSIEYIDEHKIINRKKEPLIVLSLDFILKLAVEYTILLHNQADPENIKICLRLLLDRFKEDYEEVQIKF